MHRGESVTNDKLGQHMVAEVDGRLHCPIQRLRRSCARDSLLQVDLSSCPGKSFQASVVVLLLSKGTGWEMQRDSLRNTGLEPTCSLGTIQKACQLRVARTA